MGCHWQLKPVMLIQIVFYCISFVPQAGKYLAITPGYFLLPNYWVWTILTFSFYNYSVFFLALDLLTLFLLENLLTFYKWYELLKFCALVNLLSAVFTACFIFIGYAITFDTDLLFKEQICGFLALLGGVTVIGRQMMGETLLLDFPLGKIRYKHIPFMCVIFICLLSLVRLTTMVSLSMFSMGIWIAWIYLRFFQRHENGIKGDLTDTFTFSGFFPNHLEPPIAIVCNGVFNLLLKLRLCKHQIVQNSNTPASVLSFTVTIPDISQNSFTTRQNPSSDSTVMLLTSGSVDIVSETTTTKAPAGNTTQIAGPSQKSSTVVDLRV
ncbi:unnamed protein product [Calicophoron daubneyi]|uniref:Transmembrane protein 115 n=1 Tax=Calicophoron daubneyi TaxID=300641 RepID=A0AAV2T0V7_CALDB